VNHDKPFLLSMVTEFHYNAENVSSQSTLGKCRGKHERQSILHHYDQGQNLTYLLSAFLTNKEQTPHLDNKHVVFGEVIRGKSVVRTVENTKTGDNDKPNSPCVIASCGQLTEGDLKAWDEANKAVTGSSGKIYEDYPEDDDDDFESDGGVVKSLEAAKEIKEIGNTVFKEGKLELAVKEYESKLLVPFTIYSQPMLKMTHQNASVIWMFTLSCQMTLPLKFRKVIRQCLLQHF
jgi:hypothetical protein